MAGRRGITIVVQRQAPRGTERPRRPPPRSGRGRALSNRSAGRLSACNHVLGNSPGAECRSEADTATTNPAGQPSAEPKPRLDGPLTPIVAGRSGAARTPRRTGAVAAAPARQSGACLAIAVGDRPGAGRRAVGAPMAPRPGELMPRWHPGGTRSDDGRPNPVGIAAGRVVPFNCLWWDVA